MLTRSFIIQFFPVALSVIFLLVYAKFNFASVLKLLEQVDPALAGPLVCFQVTVGEMRGRETPSQYVGYSNPEHLNSFIFSSNFCCMALAI